MQSLLEIQKRSRQRFEELGLPKKRDEAFRYLPLTRLPALELSPKKITFDADESLIVLPLDEAFMRYGALLQSRFSKSFEKEKNPLYFLTHAEVSEGLFIYVPPGVKAEKPLHLSVQDGGKVHLFLGAGAELKCEITLSSSRMASSLIDINLDRGARLEFVSEKRALGWQFDQIRATLKQNAFFHYYHFSAGAEMVRTDLAIALEGENSEARCEGLAMLGGKCEDHGYVLMHHKAPHTRSHQHFKALLSGKSRSSFEGKILVDQIAQKTDAYQLSNHLLLSGEAICHSKPNLEIFADDVKASHGATVTELDKESLYYIRTRGIDEAQARVWLKKAFCFELTPPFAVDKITERLWKLFSQERG